MGDPSGIGPDISLQSWLRRKTDNLAAFAILADMDLLADRAHQLGLDVPLEEIKILGQASKIFDHALPVLPVRLPVSAKAGEPSSEAVPAIMESIERSVTLAMSGEASAVVTNPIAKDVMIGGGFDFPGHTEYLGALSEQFGIPAIPVMMLAGPELRSVPVTIHISLAAVPKALTSQKIIETTQITARGLQRWFGIEKPRLALTGLNPHAGENGRMGEEEIHIIIPAINQLRQSGYDVTGPHPADALFHEKARTQYDVAIAMYHDQALIPLKTLSFDEGVNVTLGLPYIRTSPDHGTAFSIAGSGEARADSLIAAMKMAGNMVQADNHGSHLPGGEA